MHLPIHRVWVSKIDGNIEITAKSMVACGCYFIIDILQADAASLI